MSLRRNIIVWDTETSGLDPEDGSEVIELCATAINYWDLADHHAGMFHAYIKPNRPEKAQAGALKVIGDGWARAQDEGLSAKVVWQNYADWVSSINDSRNVYGKPITIAHNAVFDNKFAKYHMREYGIVKKGNWGYDYPWGFEFCSMNMFWMLCENDPTVENLKLDTFLDRLGNKRANAKIHNAKEDVLLLADGVKRVMKFTREAQRRMGSPVKDSNELPLR